jgi:hypothetical protein
MSSKRTAGDDGERQIERPRLAPPQLRRLKRKEVLERQGAIACPRRRHWDDDANNFDEDGKAFITEDEVVELLQSMERYRQRIADAAFVFSDWLEGSPQLQEVWNKFIQAGGITADDFRKFLDGRFRYRLIRQRRHLRLVVNNKSQRRVVRCPGGDDAA